MSDFNWNSFLDFLESQNVIKIATGILVGKALAKLISVFIQDILHPFIDPFDDWYIEIGEQTIMLDKTLDALLVLIVSFALGYLVFVSLKNFRQ